MRNIRSVCLSVAAALAILFQTAPSFAAEKLVFGHFLDTASSPHKYALWAAEEIKTRSGNRLQVEVIGGGVLGNSDVKMLEALKLGAADLIYAGAAPASKDYAPLAIASAPLNFRDFTHWKLFRDSDIYKEIRENYEQVSGNMIVGTFYYGQRHMTTKAPVNSIADLKGMKLRVPPVPLSLQLFRTLGAAPVSVPLGEVYDSLKQGIVDGQENPLPTILARKFHEVAPNITLTGHMTDSQVILGGSDKWKALSEADKQLIAGVLQEAAGRISEEIAGQEGGALDQLKAAGAVVNSFDRAQLAEALKPMLTGNAPWAGSLYQKVQALQ